VELTQDHLQVAWGAWLRRRGVGAPVPDQESNPLGGPGQA